MVYMNLCATPYTHTFLLFRKIKPLSNISVHNNIFRHKHFVLIMLLLFRYLIWIMGILMHKYADIICETEIATILGNVCKMIMDNCGLFQCRYQIRSNSVSHGPNAGNFSCECQSGEKSTMLGKMFLFVAKFPWFRHYFSHKKKKKILSSWYKWFISTKKQILHFSYSPKIQWQYLQNCRRLLIFQFSYIGLFKWLFFILRMCDSDR